LHLSPNRETVVKHLAEPWIAVRNWGAHQSGVGLGANIVIGTIAAKGRHGDPVDFSDQLKRYFLGRIWIGASRTGKGQAGSIPER
jgi:hypothetical protein